MYYRFPNQVCAIIRYVRHQGLKAPITLTKILPRGKQWPKGLRLRVRVRVRVTLTLTLTLTRQAVA